MSKMTMVTGLDAAKENTIIEMREDGTPLAHMIVDAVATEQVIRQIALCRSQMQEQVSDDLEPNFRVETIAAPGWRLTADHTGAPGVLMALRHPGFGWLAFHLEPERAMEISKWLAVEASKHTPATD